MKVMVYEGPRRITLTEVEEPPLSEGQVRIQTLFSGISHGTEMAVYRGTAPFFRTRQNGSTRLFVPADTGEVWSYPVRSCDPGVWYMGYASVGRVTEVGAGVTTILPGDVVYINAPHQTHAVKNENQVIKLPKGLKPEYGIFFTNLMTAFNAILDTKIKLGDTVAVSGLGVLGQLAAQMCRLSGARVIGVDPIEKRGAAAMENGMAIHISPLSVPDAAMEIRKLTNNKGPDAVIEVSGNIKALNEALRIAAPDTAVTAAGWYQGSCSNLSLSEEFHHNRIALRCSQTGSTNPEIRHMWDVTRKEKTCMSLLTQLKLENLITTRIPYDSIAEAYRTIDTDPAQVIQTVITY